MRRALYLLLVVALAGAGAALAGKGDPLERLTPKDQARAKAMLVRRSDFSSPYKAIAPLQSGDAYCKALDESDLTISGKAESPTFQAGVESVSSVSRVYASVRDSNASWRRGTSAAGEKCLRTEFDKSFATQGAHIVSFARTPFPKLTDRTSAYRIVVEAQGLRVFLDVIALKQSRAQVGLLLLSGLTPMPRDEEVRVARIVAGRMKAAMRGA